MRLKRVDAPGSSGISSEFLTLTYRIVDTFSRSERRWRRWPNQVEPVDTTSLAPTHTARCRRNGLKPCAYVMSKPFERHAIIATDLMNTSLCRNCAGFSYVSFRTIPDMQLKLPKQLGIHWASRSESQSQGHRLDLIEVFKSYRHLRMTRQ